MALSSSSRILEEDPHEDSGLLVILLKELLISF